MKANLNYSIINPIDVETALTHKSLFPDNVHKIKYTEVADRLTNYLKQHHLVFEVKHDHRFSDLQDIYGYQLKFKLRENDFAFHLLNAFFKAKKNKDVTVTARKPEREFLITIHNSNDDGIIDYFSNFLKLLDNELQYRKLLKAQIEFDQFITELTVKFRPHGQHF
jgi:hypothetical protein